MRIGIFGGSFNPIHNAHIKLSEKFLTLSKLDRIYFVPTNVTPLKDNSKVISGIHRYNMCKLAVIGNEKFTVSDFEINKSGVSYTCDTIAYFKSIFPDSDLFLITGADMFNTLDKWHNARYIFDNVIVLTAPRDDSDYADLISKSKEYEIFNCKSIICEDYIEDLSATYLRELIKDGKDISKYVSKEVLEYINNNNLYR